MNPGSFDVLGIGTTAVDDMVFVRKYPPADQKERVLRKARRFGGLMGTALAAVARLGARAGFGGVLGSGELSAAVRRALDEAGVDCTPVIDEPGAGPAHSVIIVDEQAGTRNIFFYLDPLRDYPASAMTRQLLGATRVLLVDQLGPAPKIAAAQMCRELGVPVVADMEWSDWPLVPEFMAAIDHLLVPHHFAIEVTGLHDPASALKALSESRACTAITCGRDGCYYLTRDSGSVEHIRSIEVNTVETTGCGDVFHGAYAAALARGRSIPDCLRWASAAAAVYASRPSGWEYLPTSQDVEALIGTEGGTA